MGWVIIEPNNVEGMEAEVGEDMGEGGVVEGHQVRRIKRKKGKMSKL